MRLEVKKHADRDAAYARAVDYLERRVAGEINLVEPPSKAVIHQTKRLLASDTQKKGLEQEAAIRGVSVRDLKRLILERAETTDTTLLHIEQQRVRFRKRLEDAGTMREIALIRDEIDQAFALK